MEQAGGGERIDRFISELFVVAGQNTKLARKIYILSSKTLYTFDLIEEYLLSEDPNVMSLAAEIAMDNFESELKIKHLIEFQRVSNTLLKARARVIALQRKYSGEDFNYLIIVQIHPFVADSGNLAREILLSFFASKLSMDLLFEFQKSKDVDIRNRSKWHLFNMPLRKLSYDRLSDLLSDKNSHVASLAAEMILKKFPEKLTWIDLLLMQTSPSSVVRDLARMQILAVPKERIHYASLVEYKKIKNQCVRDMITELIIRNFDFHLSGKEIFEFQKSKNPIIRGGGKDLALSLPASRWVIKSIKKALGSHSIEIRNLANMLDAKFADASVFENEAVKFLNKHGL